MIGKNVKGALVATLLLLGCQRELESAPGQAAATERAAGDAVLEVEVQEQHVQRQPLPPAEEIAKLPADGGSEFNRLIFEESPYLRQHARNPVDWYPWGAEAFELARQRGVPVFLSVGYATCHWCHVMEHESFEDDQVAGLLNEHFVCVKVDREERPDIDEVFMRYTRAASGGSGGWPMTVFLTPEKKPFHAGTYFPKHSRFGRPGMMELLPALSREWVANNGAVLEAADKGAQFLSETSGGSPGEAPGAEIFRRAYAQFTQSFDSDQGGFGDRPKFPTPQNLRFLLRYHRRSGDPAALEMVRSTLEHMRRGGIFDHVGFGFHRYSTDDEWLVPHFEKMLYDQALIALAYVEAFQVTGDPDFERTAREIYSYVLRDMTSPGGGFYSAEDADSEGEEGLFYLWRPEEVSAVLGPKDGRLWNEIYGVDVRGNFLEESTQERTGESIFHLSRPLAETAAELELSEDELRARLEPLRAQLFEAREPRVHPLKDDKVLTDWNGLMIASLAVAARAFDEPEYARAAARAADFVLSELRLEDGRLIKRWRGGEARFDAVLEDYAYLAWGLLELYQTSHEPRRLGQALELADQIVARFADEEAGGFYMTPVDGETLFARSKTIYDGAQPAGNSVAADTLLRLGRIAARPELEELAAGVFSCFAGELGQVPSGHARSLMALEFALGPTHEVVVVGDPEADDTRAMLRALHGRFLPNAVVILRPSGEAGAEIGALAEYTRAQIALDGKATAYVCQEYACQAPTTEIDAMLASLAGSDGQQ